MVLTQLPSNASVHNGKTSLAFSGNSQDMYVRASIPWTNLLLTVIGCIAVVVVGVAVAVLAKREEEFLLKYSSASTVVEAITDHGKFPPFMLHMHLRDCITANVPEPPLSSLRVGDVIKRAQPSSISSVETILLALVLQSSRTVF
ncbi:hypothetical protein JG688_00003099 [Phytophthora aleatoria]|uniref:Uncharacterized protein n=1 Tax=Phytophthora aleatoria TaxID=2496075 RepID=A0A8J5JBL5_9STRA|nr:hypothetical protein JG688_00003099 [Phytophthora aleatoria]